MQVHIDITELVGNPVRTGVQRVVRETLRHWPAEDELVMCRYDAAIDALVLVPPEARAVLLEEEDEFVGAPVEMLRARLAEILAASPVQTTPESGIKVLIPEVFFDERRTRFYLRKLSAEPDSVLVFFHDFIPWLRPDDIGVERSGALMPYIRLAQHTRNAAFNSAATNDDWRLRILREPERSGMIVPLGADGLGLEPQRFSASRKTYVCLGSIDGRKNQNLVVRAFRQLWREGCTARLVVVGQAFESAGEIAREVLAARDEPLFDYVEHASDDKVKDILRQARATIYASVVEGFGLPPVESLAAGIPVIATTKVPSLAGLHGQGTILIDTPQPEGIVAAVRALSDDAFARRTWDAAAQLRLPTWRGFGRAMNEWVRSVA